MRVTVSHDKGKEEAKRIVNDASDQILRPLLSGPLRMSDVRTQWNGSTLEFSLTASVGGAPVCAMASTLSDQGVLSWAFRGSRNSTAPLR